MFKKVLVLLVCLIFKVAEAQTSRNVLFLGNSYTGVNNLPQLVSNLAQSRGDVLTFQSYVPGGYTLQAHLANSFSTGKIINGGWDYIVLQEQSQLPSFESYDASAADSLCAMNAKYNPCARTMFYMTWGRKNGDATNCVAWPPVCTYLGMDSLLSLRYMEMALHNKAEISPVGVVWKYIRQNYPGIELYWPDQSHPSIAGSYLAACCFYTMVFKKDPVPVTFTASLSATDATVIRQAVKALVFDHLSSWDLTDTNPHTDFSFTAGTQTRECIFTNNSHNAESYLWNFGDGNTSGDTNPVHVYSSDGIYTVTLTAINCDLTEIKKQTKQITIDLNPVIYANEVIVSPNPTTGFFKVKIPVASIGTSYRIVDALGRIIESGILNKEINDFNLHAANSGLLILELGKVKRKIIKY